MLAGWLLPAACLPQPVPLSTRAYLSSSRVASLTYTSACSRLLATAQEGRAAFYFPRCAPASPPSGVHTSCTQLPIGPTLGMSSSLCSVSLASQREKSGSCSSTNSLLRKRAALHPAEEDYHREAGKTAGLR